MKKQDMHTTDYILVTHGVRSLRLNAAAGVQCSKVVTRVLLPRTDSQYDPMHRLMMTCDECGQNLQNRERVMGGNSGKVMKCGGICRSAKGPACDCPCEGANHGSNH